MCAWQYSYMSNTEVFFANHFIVDPDAQAKVDTWYYLVVVLLILYYFLAVYYSFLAIYPALKN